MICIGKRVSRKLTITVSEAVGRQDTEAAYREMAADQAREKEALECCEGVVGDALAEPHASR